MQNEILLSDLDKALKIAEQIDLTMTCGACPEQYDAYYDGNIVGYLRLRHGNFTVHCGDTCVYSANSEGDGVFQDEERDHHLFRARLFIACHLLPSLEISQAGS